MIKPTKEQVEIRDAEQLGLLVIAPAGCGKTEALALRTAGLIERGQIEAPRRVLITTFTNRARDNINERLRAHIRPNALRELVTVANFHGLAARLFRAHANVIGMDPQLQIPESDWVREQCRLRSLTFNQSHGVQESLRIAKQQPFSDTQVEELLISSGDDVALGIERQRRDECRLTYDDLPRLAELILANAAVAELYRQHFAAVIVDEFQDLTPQQLRIVNTIARGRTAFAGDLAQGIFGFAGAAPDEILATIRQQCSRTIEFATSHRSSPAVLDMVNALARRTGGRMLESADPSSWPSGGLAGRGAFDTTAGEAEWVAKFARFVLTRAPHHRIGVIARTAPRRRFVDGIFSEVDLPIHRWDDPLLDTDTATVISDMLRRLDDSRWREADNLLGFLRDAAAVDEVQDPWTRQSLADSVHWCHDLLLEEGLSPKEIRGRIRIGDDNTLLTAPGVHLLTGHIGKGQQFDWVVVVGAEEGCIPDFRSASGQLLAEEARVFSVMLSRARHGVVVLYAREVQAANGKILRRQPSQFLTDFDPVQSCRDRASIVQWLRNADWEQLGRR